MATIIKPTIGRVVLFKQMTADVFPGSGGTVPAVVTSIHNDRLVNLCVFDANGGTLGRTSVTIVQPGDEAPAYQHCFWMDYQLGQAAKTEAAEAKLKEPAAVA